MEIRINDRYTLTGTPAEMVALMILMDTTVEDAPAPDPVEQEPEPKQAKPVTFHAETTPAVVETQEAEPTPAPKKPRKPRKAPETGWGKARALRNAGWSYANIGRELHVSAQTVANHLGGKTDDE